jgi:hypothetical protein
MTSGALGSSCTLQLDPELLAAAFWQCVRQLDKLQQLQLQQQQQQFLRRDVSLKAAVCGFAERS